jgi:hypothetical protein
MRKVAVAPAIAVTCACATLDRLIINGPTEYWWFPIALAIPAITMSVVCFDRRLRIGHYVLITLVATFGIYWIAMGVAGYCALALESTPSETAILQALESDLPGWRNPDKSTSYVVVTPLSVFFVIMGLVWLLPTRRIWDRPTEVPGSQELQ